MILDGDRLEVFNAPIARSKLGISGAGLMSINVSAGSTTNNLSAVTFADSNGVTFGLGAGVVTASVAAGSGAGTGFTTATTAGTDIVGTLDTNGLSLGVPAYLTTAQPPGAYLTTAQPPGAYLTTAALSQDSSNYAGINGAITGGSITVNTSGVSVDLPAYLTTAQPPGAYLTTAALSGDTSKYAGINGSISGGSLTLNTSGLTIDLPAYLTTAQPPGAYLTTAALSGDTSKYAGTSTAMAGGSVTLNTAGISLSLPAYLTTFAYPRLDQVLDQNTDKVFSCASNMVQFQFAGGGSFSTNATRAGMFELDVQGNVTAEADMVHAHQHGGAPTRLDLFHIEGDGANVTGLRLQMSASVAAEINQPIKFTREDTNYSVGSVPMILGTGMSNVVANLNANYLQGKVSSDFQSAGAYLTTAALTNVTSDRAGTGTSVVTTGGTDLSCALNTNGLTIAYPKWLTAAGGGGAGTGTSVATTGGTDLTLGVDTAGVSIGYPKWITTYDATSIRAGTGTSLQTTSGTDLSMALNTAGLTVAYPKWITTYDATSVRAGTNTSVATTSGTDLSCALNTSGLTIAYPKWITTYDATSARAGTNTSVATTTGTDVSCALNTSGLTIAYPKYLTTAAATNVTSNNLGLNTSVATTAGTDLAMTGNTSGLTIGYPKWLTTAAAAPSTWSYWGNVPFIDEMQTGASAVTKTSGSSIYVQPFFLPYHISVGWIRFLASFNDNAVGTAGTTSANNSYSVQRYTTIGLVVYTQGAGANSRSIQSLTSTSGGFTGLTSYGAAANGSRYTVTIQKTYPVNGTTSQYTSSYAVSSGSIVISSDSNTLFTGARFLDLSFGISLGPGAYWLGIGASTSSASQSSHISFAGTAGMAMSINCITQTTIAGQLLGAASSASDYGLQKGQGAWSTNASNWSTGSMGVNSISQMASSPMVPFWFLREA